MRNKRLPSMSLVVALSASVAACDSGPRDRPAQRDVYGGPKALENCIADWGTAELCKQPLTEEEKKKAVSSAPHTTTFPGIILMGSRVLRGQSHRDAWRRQLHADGDPSGEHCAARRKELQAGLFRRAAARRHLRARRLRQHGARLRRRGLTLMRREAIPRRDSWQRRLEDAGCYFHTIDGKPYWREDAAYVLSSAEIDRIEDAGDELHRMCLDHAADVVGRGDYRGYGFPDEVKAGVEASWKRGDRHLYGRLDLGYDGTGLKLYEYNADTPTALPEASVWQWHALEDRGWPDQFNAIHEHLLARWQSFARSGASEGRTRVHFAAMRDGQHEDWGNVHYLLETAAEAGFDGSSIPVEEIGWNGHTFTDVQERPIELLFKLYPWEWMMADAFGWKVRESQTRFIEPAWKMLLSTKALLPLLWRRHQGHPLLLEAHFEADAGSQSLSHEWVRKPVLGREGANITRGRPGSADWQPRSPVPLYDKHGYIVQRWFPSRSFGGISPVLGVWIVADKACGLGIREDAAAFTTNASCFVPHYFTSET